MLSERNINSCDSGINQLLSVLRKEISLQPLVLFPPTWNLSVYHLASFPFSLLMEKENAEVGNFSDPPYLFEKNASP